MCIDLASHIERVDARLRCRGVVRPCAACHYCQNGLRGDCNKCDISGITISRQTSTRAAEQNEGAAPVAEGHVFHTLDALRGIAAIGVVVLQMSQLFTPIAAPGGYLAVDLFFMMSGVVLSHAYEPRFRA